MKSNVIRLRRHISSDVRRPRSNPEDVDDEGNQSAHGRHESTGQDETRSEIPWVDVNGVASSIEGLVPILSTPWKSKKTRWLPKEGHPR